MSIDVVVHSEFSKSKLLEADLADDPLTQLRRWIEEVTAAGVSEFQAMSMATSTRTGVPSVRIVYLRGVDPRGILFFTNYNSRKGNELSENPRAAALLYWKELERQVRIEGIVVKGSESESDAYFAGRPRESCIGAWASLQSQPLASRELLEQRTTEFEKQFAGGPVPRPPNWGGYWLQPESIEFWQGGAARLHDRLIYRQQPDGTWHIERLFP
ncbi:MAG: pyridoxamine 5'-phosphate oxidase [Planctomycetia bacterium]|nr:pyridoxamine 5'-phosphate oxidase [Planctomycetia bacterium]